MTTAAAAFSHTSPPALSVDALIIGAGPAGLFQVFQLGLQGIHSHVVDALPHIGGQCAQIYAHKPIYDIPGLPFCTGSSLVQSLAQQMAPLQPDLHLGQQVQHIESLPDGRWLAVTTAGTVFHARSLVIAAGVGAFVPKALKVAGVDELAGGQLHYHPQQLDQLPQVPTLIYGGDEEAVDAALRVAPTLQAPLHLMYRRDAFQAPAHQLQQLQQLRDSGGVQVHIGQITALEHDAGQLQQAQWMDGEGQEHALPVAQLLVYQGISPRLGPLADWGLALERKQLVVEPASMATSAPGIYAVGDIVSYPGKKKLILCGFHEATMAAFAIAEYLTGEKPLLQYTTTSSSLRSILGVQATD